MGHILTPFPGVEEGHSALFLGLDLAGGRKGQATGFPHRTEDVGQHRARRSFEIHHLAIFDDHRAMHLLERVLSPSHPDVLAWPVAAPRTRVSRGAPPGSRSAPPALKKVLTPFLFFLALPLLAPGRRKTDTSGHRLDQPSVPQTIEYVLH